MHCSDPSEKQDQSWAFPSKAKDMVRKIEQLELSAFNPHRGNTDPVSAQPVFQLVAKQSSALLVVGWACSDRVYVVAEGVRDCARPVGRVLGVLARIKPAIYLDVRAVHAK